MQKLRLTLHIFFARRTHTKKSIRKLEIWEKNLSVWQKFKINARIKWRRFDTQTRGMGLIFVMLISVVILSSTVPAMVQGIQKLIMGDKYKTALDTACKDKEFYAFNFQKCEDIGARP